jgi:hypothetical protein
MSRPAVTLRFLQDQLREPYAAGISVCEKSLEGESILVITDDVIGAATVEDGHGIPAALNGLQILQKSRAPGSGVGSAQSFFEGTLGGQRDGFPCPPLKCAGKLLGFYILDAQRH